MKLSYLWRLLLIVGAIIVLIAPFTFIKPTVKVQPEPKIEPPKVVVKKPVVVEKPLHNVVLPDFAKIRDVKSKKRQFFNFIRPAVIKENNRLKALRVQVEAMLSQLALGEPLTEEQDQQFTQLVKTYRVNKKASLLQQAYDLYYKVDEIPTELVLVQAANESAWGTSRFARIGLNFFGIWCYKKGCGMVPRARNDGATHEVEAFDSVEHAVVRYLHNINTNSAYSTFRSIRQQLREQNQPLIPAILATGLLPYSERGADYVLELTEMLRHNQQYFGVESSPQPSE